MMIEFIKNIYRFVIPLSIRKPISQWRAKMYCYSILRSNRKKCDTANTIVLMRLDGIGDFIIWLDAAKEYRVAFPNKKVILVCCSYHLDIAKAFDYFDEIIPITLQALYSFKRYVLPKELFNISADMLIQCVYSRTIAMDFVASCIPAKEKISIDGDCTNIDSINKKITDTLYDKLVITPDTHLHEVQRNAELLRGLGHPFITHLPLLPIFESDRTMLPNRDYFVVFPGGSQSERRWSVSNFYEVAERIYMITGLTCCICGAQNEERLAAEFSALCVDKISYINLVDKTTLAELIEVIRKARFIISNDTSAIHIAVATTTPSICILGPLMFGRFMPYSVDDTDNRLLSFVCCEEMKCAQCYMKYSDECKACIAKQGKYLCIYNVSIDSVNEKVDKLLLDLRLKRINSVSQAGEDYR